jgi:hypothetical protein
MVRRRKAEHRGHNNTALQDVIAGDRLVDENKIDSEGMTLVISTQEIIGC